MPSAADRQAALRAEREGADRAREGHRRRLDESEQAVAAAAAEVARRATWADVACRKVEAIVDDLRGDHRRQAARVAQLRRGDPNLAAAKRELALREADLQAGLRAIRAADLGRMGAVGQFLNRYDDAGPGGRREDQR